MDATRELLETGGVEQANIQTIAKEAGVTRPTVYQQFGSHSELLLAVMNDALDRADGRSVRKALQIPDAAKAVRGVVRGSCKFWDSEATLFRRFKGMALVDESTAEVDRLKEEVRRGHIRSLAARLAEQGQLRRGISRNEAFERLYLLTSFEVYETLRNAGHSADAIASRLGAMVEDTVLV
jgi:AcrR family transcriptional regulator